MTEKAVRARSGSAASAPISRAVLAGESQSGRAAAISPKLRLSSRCAAAA